MVNLEDWGSGAVRLMDLGSLEDFAEFSSGEKAVKRVSGVPSCLYESAPPLEESGDDCWKDGSNKWLMAVITKRAVGAGRVRNTMTTTRKLEVDSGFCQ